MKIVHINTTEGKGGAALLMRTLSENLYKQHNIISQFIVGFSSVEEENFFLINKQIKHFLGYRKFSRILSELGFQNYCLPLEAQFILKKVAEIKPDLIHLHNIHGGYFQTNLIKKFCKIASVVWTFHDMFPFTGHCAHSFDCERWKTGCGNCSYLDTYPSIKKDRTKTNLKYKKKIYDNSDFTIVAPSKWLYDCVKKSVLKDNNIRLIYNGIDTNIFKKTDKLIAREKLSLQKDKKIILFSADGGVANPFKGGKFVFEIYDMLKMKDDILFLNIGGDERSVLNNWINYGYIQSEDEMALMYSAADIYLFPTLAEVFGLVIVEAMTCGLPVVTFDVGGVPELVEHMKTGYVAKYKDPEDLMKGIEMLLNNEKLRDNFGAAGIKRAQELFDVETMVRKYNDLYIEVLSKRKR